MRLFNEVGNVISLIFAKKMHSMGFCSVLVGFIVSLGGGCIVCFGGDFCVSVLVVVFFFSCEASL